MSNKGISDLLQDILYAEEHHLLQDPVGQAAREAVALGVTDDLIRDLIQKPVRKHRILRMFEGPYLLPQLKQGEIRLGRDTKGQQILAFVQWLNAHVLCVAGSGAGKTNAARYRVLQVIPHVQGAWLFDFRKKEFAALRPFLAKAGIDLLIVLARQSALNPLQVPQHVHPAEFAPLISDILVQVLRLPPRATKLLHSVILRLYRRFGVFEGREIYPMLIDLHDAIAADTTANPQARQAIVDSLEPVIASLGQALAYRFGWTTDELAKRKIAFDLSGVSEVDKDLILNTLVLGAFASRIAQGVSNKRMDLYICCDEAARLVSANATGSGMADLIGLVRGTGIGLDLSVQSADVAPAILSNTATKMVGRCGNARDYDVIGGAMGLTPEQRRWMHLNLKPGRFVVQVGDGDWHNSFVLDCPMVNVKTINPGTAEYANLGDLEQLRVIQAPCPPPDNTTVASIDNHEPDTTAPSVLDEAERRFLDAVVNHPGQPSSAYPQLAGVGTRRAQRIRIRLVKLGFLRVHAIYTNGRGRSAIVLEPLKSPSGTASSPDQNSGGQS